MSDQTAIKERTILNCAVLEAPPEKVFEALTTAQSLTGFFADRAEFDRTLGGSWRMFDDKCSKKTEGKGKVLVWEPPHLVRLEWNWYRTDLHPTEVTYRILPHEKGSLLIVHHRGWGAGDEWDFEHDDHSSGWTKVIASLATFMGVTLSWAGPAAGQPDAHTYEILKSHREQIQSQYDVASRERDRLQKDVDKLKKSTGVVNLKAVDQLEQKLDEKMAEARQLELDLKDVELLMK